MRVELKDIKERSIAVFEKAGLSSGDAKIITDVLLETEQRGVFTHGFMRLERYTDCIKSGGIKTDGEYEILFDSPSWASIDGKDNLGIVISYKATQLAMKKAKETTRMDPKQICDSATQERRMAEEYIGGTQ